MGIINNINLNIDDFKRFREGGYFYVDKSVMIEHIIEDSNNIILLPRPRRMGKTMNLTMLRSFFDMNEDSALLFHGLYIERRPAYDRLGSSPVLLLDFKSLQPETYRLGLALAIKDISSKYLAPDEIDPILNGFLSTPEAMTRNSVSLPRMLMKNIEAVTGKRTVVLLDEYDKLFMDSIDKPYFEEVRQFTKAVMLSMFKGNPHLERGIITGVNRIAQESMFSDLNNLTICDVYDNTNTYETDFGFTENEVAAIVPAEFLDEARLRYNNYRVGNSKVYFTYSLLNYLSTGKFENYWGKSGSMMLAQRGLNTERFDSITQLIGGFPDKKMRTGLYDRISVEDLNFRDNSAYYTMLVQTGYLTFDYTDTPDKYDIYIPNLELKNVWQEFILKYFNDVNFQSDSFNDLLRGRLNQDEFEEGLENYITNRLSYFDLRKRSPELIYHIYVLGLLTAFGYQCISNRESGEGRFDIITLLPQYNVIFEFKKAETKKKIEASAEAAIAQIREKRYFADYDDGKPMLLAGIGFSGKQCHVKTELL